jgi:periplasmic divalent cation tolerance protein
MGLRKPVSPILPERKIAVDFMTDKVLILTTAGSEAEATKIAQALVERKAAACVNIIPRIQSVYRWQEKVEKAEECLLLIKTSKANEDRVRSTLRELHSYELPECLTIGVDGGSAEYLRWMDEAVDMKQIK